jgi:hypothetical protein
MDKALFRAYVKELVKEQIQDSVEKEVKKILPKLLEEAVAEIKNSDSSKMQHTPSKFSKSQLAEMLGLERHGNTIMATTDKMITNLPRGVTEDSPVVQAINKDYSELMKKMGISK